MTNKELFYIFEPKGCWHEWEWIPLSGMQCKNCDIDVYGEENPLFIQRIPLPENPDFSTWQGFGWLWQRAKIMPWWDEFALKWTYNIDPENGRYDGYIDDDIVNPFIFCNKLKEFLKKKF